MAKLKWQGEQQAAATVREAETGRIGTERALTDLASQRNYQDRASRQSLASRGLGSSTTGFETFSREEGLYGLSQSRALEDFGRQQDSFQAALNAILSGYSVEQAAALAQSADRYGQRQADLARTGAPEAPPPPAAAPPSASPGIAGKTDVRATGPPPSSNHWWTGTRWVPIGKSVSASHGNYASGPPPSSNHAWDGKRWVRVR
jgi:hypothetical protein